MNILSLDQSTHFCGYAIFKDNKRSISGVYEITSDTLIERVHEFKVFIEKLVNEHKIEFVVAEETFLGKNVDTLKKLTFTLGAVANYCYDNNIKFEQFYPTTWKSYHKILKDKRAQQKMSSIDKVEELLNIRVKKC